MRVGLLLACLVCTICLGSAKTIYPRTIRVVDSATLVVSCHDDDKSSFLVGLFGLEPLRESDPWHADCVEYIQRYMKEQYRWHFGAFELMGVDQLHGWPRVVIPSDSEWVDELNPILVRIGCATRRDDDGRYVHDEEIARRAQRGIWSNDPNKKWRAPELLPVEGPTTTLDISVGDDATLSRRCRIWGEPFR
jgi:hypothetical protein